MASLAGTTSRTEAIVALSRLDATKRSVAAGTTRLEHLHAFLADGAPAHVLPVLAAAGVRAARIAVAGGENEASDAIAAHIYAADVVANLAAEGDLAPTDTQITAGALAPAAAPPAS